MWYGMVWDWENMAGRFHLAKGRVLMSNNVDE